MAPLIAPPSARESRTHVHQKKCQVKDLNLMTTSANYMHIDTVAPLLLLPSAGRVRAHDMRRCVSASEGQHWIKARAENAGPSQDMRLSALAETILRVNCLFNVNIISAALWFRRAAS